jgi:hypothetical protein
MKKKKGLPAPMTHSAKGCKLLGRHASGQSIVHGMTFKTWSGDDLGSAVGLGGQRKSLAVMPELLKDGLPVSEVRLSMCCKCVADVLLMCC